MTGPKSIDWVWTEQLKPNTTMKERKKSLKAWFVPSGPWCEGYIKGPSTHLATIKQATRKLCNIALYLKNESISETAVAMI